MPLVGISPSTTLMFTSACVTIMVVMPSARKAPNESGARRAMRSPRQATTPKQNRTSGRAEQSEFFGDHGVDEVGVRLGQIEQLLDAVHQPPAPDTARSTAMSDWMIW